MNLYLKSLIVALLGIAVSWAGATGPAQPGAETPPYGFSDLEMYKVTWGAMIVAIGDVNGDGLTDLVIPENVRARIQCFLQQPPGAVAAVREAGLSPNLLPDDRRFEKRPYLAGKRVFNLALGDLNGDGRTDMAYYGDPAELVVVYQAPTGEWGETVSFDIQDGSQRPHTMIVSDFNGDDRQDLCLLGNQSTYFLYQGENGKLGRPEEYPGVPEGTFALMSGDFNADGRADLLYAAGNEDTPFSIRLQDPRGRMSPNVPLEVAGIRAMIAGNLDREKGDEVLAIEQATGRLVVYKLTETRPKNGLLRGQPRIYPLPTSGSVKPRSMTVIDLDLDGRLDVIATNPRASELEWFRQDESGALLRPKRFPTLQNASDVLAADLDGDKKPEVLVLSPDEQTLGIAERLPTGRIGFPRRLLTEGKPTAMGVGDLNRDGVPEILYSFTEGYKRELVILKRQGDDFVVEKKLPIEKVRSDPEGIAVADANQDGRPDILVFEPFGGMRIFAQAGPGEFVDKSQSPRYGAGLVMKTRIVSFALGDVAGDEKPEILVAQQNFARALRLDADGALQIVDQFNGRSPDSRIEGCGVADLDGDGVNEVLLLDAHAKAISVLKRQELGTYRIVQNVSVGAIQLRGMHLGDFDRDNIVDALVFGAKKMVTIRSAASHLELEETAAYETETEGGNLADVALGDLNQDNRPDVVLNETKRNSLEILSYDAEGKRFDLKLRFQVFEKKSFPGRRPGGSGGRVEPRSMEIADVSNDGKQDLILLIHDRVNVYPQD